MLLDTMVLLNGIAVGAIIIARILERKILILPSAILFLIVGVQIFIDATIQYYDSSNVLTTFTLLGQNIWFLFAVAEMFFGLIMGLDSASID